MPPLKTGFFIDAITRKPKMLSDTAQGVYPERDGDPPSQSRRSLLQTSIGMGASVGLAPSLALAAGSGAAAASSRKSGDRLNPASYKTFEIDGYKHAVFDEGDASLPTIVMFHGAPHSSQEFRFNVPALREAGFRVVAPDFLGAGGSDRPRDHMLYTVALDYQRALKLVDAMGLKRFYVAGGDRGSVPVWLLAALNPDRVLGVIAENISHLNGWAVTGVEQKRRSWYMLYFQFEAARGELEKNDWALARAILEHHPDFDEFILEDWRKPNGLEASWLNWYKANVNPDRSPPQSEAPDVSAPVLLIYSMNDSYVGPEQLATSQKWIKGPLELLRIDGAGHFIARNAAKQYNSAVIDFLRRQEARRRGA